MECNICYDDFDSTNQLTNPKDLTKMGFCVNCLNYMIENNFSRYVKEIANADCEKSLSSALAHPIPLFVTANSLKGAEQFEELLCGDIIIPCKLNKPIDDFHSKRLLCLNRQEHQHSRILYIPDDSLYCHWKGL